MPSPQDSEVVCIVHNIPKAFHARDLRNYFSQFLEKGAFVCFHYRHRPEVQQISSDKTLPCGTGEDLQNGGAFNNAAGTTSAEKALTTAQPGTLPAPAETVPTEAAPTEGSADRGSRGRRTHVACCATLKLRQADLAEFLRLYDGKHWVDGSGSYLAQRCFVSRLRLPAGAASLREMIEFRPPDAMPCGNVGTPTAHFLREIQRCRLPASLVRRLGLVFPRSARRRQYSSVPLDYGTEPPPKDEEDEHGEGEDEEDESVRTARGAELLARVPAAAAAAEEQREPAVGRSAAPRASDETDAEEWDRHESLHDDVTSQERTKERLYEEEIELVWEKGGPGLVWYTDAVYWDRLRGDFDERTADDWDVDMAVYEPGAGGGDMDARQARHMRRERRLRDGTRTESAFERRRSAGPRARPSSPSSSSDDEALAPAVGAFERHTRGFGRRVLLNLGWTEGSGLGSGAGGRAEPVPAAGQTDRRGFGFVGDRLERRPAPKRRRPGPAVITTAFDVPGGNERPESVDESLPPTHMKFRQAAPS